MITVCCRFAHSFKIMCIPQTVWTEVIPMCPAQALCSGRRGEIEIAYICCIGVREPEAFELWAFSEDGIREVHPFARVQISDDFTEDNFYSHFFNARQIQIPFLGRRSVKGSVQWIDVPRAAPQSGSRVATWTENTFVYSWGTYPTVILPNVSTIRQRAIDSVHVNPHTLACRANHERLQLICVKRRQAVEREIHAQILQDICDGSDASSYDNGWFEDSNSYL